MSRITLRVWGEFACFTRPEMKVERVSYPVMTPSAARGILEAIFWKPEFQWRIREIWVLRPVRHFSILRNEVNHRAVISTALGWSKGGGGYFADEDRNRAQRHTLALRKVAYTILAEMELADHTKDPLPKYTEQFQRRLESGRCFHRPYLGCREFPAFFGPAEEHERPIDESDDLGLMLFDLEYDPANGHGTPRFFRAQLDRGVLRIPPDLYRKGESVHAAPPIR